MDAIPLLDGGEESLVSASLLFIQCVDRRVPRESRSVSGELHIWIIRL